MPKSVDYPTRLLEADDLEVQGELVAVEACVSRSDSGGLAVEELDEVP